MHERRRVLIHESEQVVPPVLHKTDDACHCDKNTFFSVGKRVSTTTVCLLQENVTPDFGQRQDMSREEKDFSFGEEGKEDLPVAGRDGSIASWKDIFLGKLEYES